MMSTAAPTPPLAYVPSPPSLRAAYIVQALGSVASNFLGVGIFFYTHHQYHWGLLANLLLATAQGVVYIGGALFAQPIAHRIGRRAGLIGLHTILGIITAVALFYIDHPAVITALLIIYVSFIAASWPLLESLVSHSADAHDNPQALSRRIAIYNLVWSAVGAFTIAVSGTVIEYTPRGVFFIPLLIHFSSALIMYFNPRVEPPADAPHAHAPDPDPALFQSRELALALSRICLPATYVVVYSLMAMMPSLSLLNSFSPVGKTLIGSAWFLTRWIAFIFLGATTFWQTRPRLLLIAASALLIAFIAVTLRLSDFCPFPVSFAADLTWMIVWQGVLGLAMGLIYAASLYFGMVLSQGSTEQGGYHEALIGLGSAIGPGVAAAAQWARPDSISCGVAAVSVVLGLSVLAAAVASLRFARR